MATVIPLKHAYANPFRDSNHWAFHEINYDGTETTIDTAEGLVSATVSALSSSVTTPSVTINQNDISDDGTAPTVVLAAGGDVATLVVITRHLGNQSL